MPLTPDVPARRSGRADGRVPTGELRIYLHPGQFAVSAHDCTMSTILGSCVGVCLHDPEARVGGLNHYLLPTQGGGTSARYGDVAIPPETIARLRSESRQIGLAR